MAIKLKKNNEKFRSKQTGPDWKGNEGANKNRAK